MTLPNGAAGIASGLQFGVTGNDGSITGLVERTQSAVSQTLQSQAKAMPSWLTSSANVWQNLRRGISLPLAILEHLAAALLGQQTWSDLTTLSTDVSGFFSGKWTSLSNVVGDIANLITGVGGTVIHDVATTINNTVTGLASTWDNFWDGVFGTTGSTGKTAADVITAASSVTATATTANTNATTATHNATSALSSIGDLISGVGGTVISDVSTAITNTVSGLSNTWNNFWDGIFGTSDATGKTAADVATAAAAVTATANTASTNAASASQAAQQATQTANSVSSVAQQAQQDAADAKTAADSVAGTAAAAEKSSQGVVDAIHQAVNGGDATGTPSDAETVLANLRAIPQENVIISATAGNAAAITFDATGAGAATGSFTGTSKSITWTHTVGAEANYLIIAALFDNSEMASVAQFSAYAVTSGTNPVQVRIPVLQFTDSADGVAVLLGAAVNPGEYTITMLAETATAGPWNGYAATSVSYCNVNSIGVTAYNNAGTDSTALTLTTAQAVNDPRSLSLVLFTNRAATATAAALSAMTGATQRTNATYTSANGLAIAVGDIPAAPANNTFGMTAAAATNSWMVAELLLEAPQATVGSFGRLMRTATNPISLNPWGTPVGETAAPGVPSGAPALPTNFFDTVQAMSDDLSAPNMNGFTVTYAGAYWVRGRVQIDDSDIPGPPTGSSSGTYPNPTTYTTTGTIFQVNMYVLVDGVLEVIPASSSSITMEFAAVVYLSPGSTVQVVPGGYLVDYTSTYTISSSGSMSPTTTTFGTPKPWKATGSATRLTVLEIALTNRSLY